MYKTALTVLCVGVMFGIFGLTHLVTLCAIVALGVAVASLGDTD